MIIYDGVYSQNAHFINEKHNRPRVHGTSYLYKVI